MTCVKIEENPLKMEILAGSPLFSLKEMMKYKEKNIGSR